ncbi:MAG: OmpA family protein [Candidatus Riflebacteria bacterium]|nr:OmpA family protein [Candidatus Riflebacteria bacterium]
MRKQKKAGHHGGAWKVAYADFVTAMMAFFLVMWILGLSNAKKKAIAEYFKQEATTAGKTDVMDFLEYNKILGNIPFSINWPFHSKMDYSKKRYNTSVNAFKEGIKRIKALKANIKYQEIEEGLRLELIEDQNDSIFEAGSGNFSAAGKKVLEEIAQNLVWIPNSIIIEGHTDSSVSKSGKDNWALSLERANTARAVLSMNGLDNKRMKELRGCADTRPFIRSDPSHFSNRRVSIIVLKHDDGQSTLWTSETASATQTQTPSNSKKGKQK